MLKISTLWTLAIAETRSCRRLTRSWVFFAMAFLVCILTYIFINTIHDDSEFIPNPPESFIDASIPDRFAISTLMNVFVAIFSIGVIFLAFDIRGRDVQNRIAEVVDSRPVSNIEIVGGRIAGILFLVLISCLILLVLMIGYESLATLNGSRFRLGIQPDSIMSLVVWNLVPNLIFYSAVVSCIATLIRTRLLVAIAALSVLVGLFWLDFHIPVRFQQSFLQFSGGAVFPSDIAPIFASPSIIGNKFAILFVSIALLSFAASVLPRTDLGRKGTAMLGSVASVVAIATFIVLVANVNGTQNLRKEWVNEHRQQDPTSFPDVQHLQGFVEILPGRKISLDIKLDVHKPTSNTTDSIVFSLNPGYDIQSLYIDGERTKNFSFDFGILKLPTDLLPEPSHEIRVQAKGRPDDRFAYLDEARDFQELSHPGVRRLGLRNSIFRRDFVALMPGIVWYPISGSVTARDQLELCPRDLFTINLTVSVPLEWRVATVGKGEVLGDQKQSTYQFQSGAPVPELALLASNFDLRSTTVAGVEFEILFNEKHVQNLDLLSPIAEQVHHWITQRIAKASAMSLAYPYGAFYVVEVPSNLRIYGGGWRMDTTLQPPGMMLVRETTFPTNSSFEFAVAEIRGYKRLSENEQNKRIFFELQNYFGNDLQGGSPHAGIARNFVAHQVSATGRGATVLQYLVNQLSNQLITQTESLSIITVAEFDEYIPVLGIGEMPNMRDISRNLAYQRRLQIAGLPSTRALMEQTALLNLDYEADPIPSFRVLLSKGHALARMMIDHYGPEAIAAFLAQILDNFRGQNFTLLDFLTVASDVGLDLEDWVRPWLEESSLPGYLVDSPSVSKLDIQSSGRSEYQTTFIVHNAESTAGLIRVSWETSFLRTQSDPIFVAGHQSKRIAIRTNKPVLGIWVEPYLAYNLERFEVTLPDDGEPTNLRSSVLPFVEDVEWRPQETVEIVVDDLDSNFSIVTLEKDSGEYVDSQSTTTPITNNDDYVQGLPVDTYPSFQYWSRLFDSSSYGNYRRTCTRIARSNQNSAARFKAVLPNEGYWKLEFYVPQPVFDQRSLGSFFDAFGRERDEGMIRPADPNSPDEHYTLRIRSGSIDRTAKLDIANATVGWNEVGQFELNATEVEVFLNDWAGHKDVMVYADAIRWTPTVPE